MRLKQDYKDKSLVSAPKIYIGKKKKKAKRKKKRIGI